MRMPRLAASSSRSSSSITSQPEQLPSPHPPFVSTITFPILLPGRVYSIICIPPADIA
jgi:hypothetical protein